MSLSNSPELAALHLALIPDRTCTFRGSPTASIHAALLRRIELFDPDLSQAMHHAPEGANSIERPWTISPLRGPLVRCRNSLAAEPGNIYRIRITVLAPRLFEALVNAFSSEHPLAAEPLFLERVPFHLHRDMLRYDSLTTYSALLTHARPQHRIAFSFRSPTAFRQGRERTGAGLEPRVCFASYLRRWNTFSPIALPEEALLEYVEANVQPVCQTLHPALMRLRSYTIPGVVGDVEWAVEGDSPYLQRIISALADYAPYCGTGMLTALGMGQTVRQRV